MMKNKMIITLKKDLRTMFRDKKSLTMMALMPLFIPLMVFFMSYINDQMLTTELDEDIKIGINYELDPIKEAIIDELDINVYYLPEDEMKEAFEDGEIIAYVIFREGTYYIYHSPNDAESTMAAMMMTSSLEAYSNALGAVYLIEQGINPANVFNLVDIQLEEVEPMNILVNMVILMAFIFTIMSVTQTSVTSATDAVAGEKEKGTLETILTFPIDSKGLIAGKYFANFIACVITAIVCIILTLISFSVVQNLFSIYDEVGFVLSISTILMGFMILVGFSLLISGATIAVASYSKTFKEAQSALTPLTFLPLVAMFLGMMNIDLSLLIVAIPGIGQAMLLNEIFVGTVELRYLLVMLISNIIFVVLLLRYLVNLYKSEKILFSLT